MTPWRESNRVKEVITSVAVAVGALGLVGFLGASIVLLWCGVSTRDVFGIVIGCLYLGVSGIYSVFGAALYREIH